ncbi:MAG: hypothetical protein CL760_11390 [Chloroflexi bacterium]|nr:hypothetical protein [Chloroflexota bacterium]|tara:strand:+ start:17447 stop:17848 length:402 start_codon:yes stop_codon:yes gene_type:complete
MENQKIIQHEDFEKIKNTLSLTEVESGLYIKAVFSEDDKHAVSDYNSQSWFESLVEKAQDQKAFNIEDIFVTHIATEHMIHYLRYGVKKGLIKKAYIEYKGNVYDFILPNGKMCGALPDGIYSENEKLLFGLL